MAEETPETTRDQQPQFLRRGEDFESLYANHVYFQPSEWDLKLTFGEVDNDKDDKAFINQHTAIAMPWLQAKIAHYFLTLQLGVYEMSHGKIPVPQMVMPPEPEPPSGDVDPASRKIYEYIRKVREQFVSSSLTPTD